MSGQLSRKPSVAIVGAGSLASTMAIALRDAGYGIDQIVSRRRAASLQRARKLARAVGAPAVAVGEARLHAQIVWFCVPDARIARAAASLADAANWKGKVALHSGGALTSDELAVLRRRGASVASVHPLMTFVPGSRPSLAAVPFAIEGNPRARASARAIVLDLGGQPFAIHRQQKPTYHAWGMFASPLLTALLAASERVAAAAGMSRKLARHRMLPILRQTLLNYDRLGAPGSFSGPIARGDIETVLKHLSVLRSVPGAREVYIALGRMALRGLPSKNQAALRKILKG